MRGQDRCEKEVPRYLGRYGVNVVADVRRRKPGRRKVRLRLLTSASTLAAIWYPGVAEFRTPGLGGAELSG
jgi:hypothetical protein